jgi:hypothetical protein
MTDLLKQIDDLVASKTFNLDALDGIKKIKDDLSKTLGSLEYAEDKLKNVTKEKLALEQQLEREKANVAALEANIKANAAIVEAGQKAVWEKQIAQASATAYQDALYTVFKPATVRETTYQSIPLSQNVNGNTYVNTYQQETKTTKEEL